MGKDDLLNDLEDHNNWRINGERLERTDDDGNTLYFYDKIEGGFLAFRKLVLATDKGMIDLSFFAKRKLHKKVIARGYRVESDLRMKALKDMQSLKPKSNFEQRLEQMQSRIDGSRVQVMDTEEKIEDFRRRIDKIEKSRSKLKTDRERIRDILKSIDRNMLNE